MTDPTDYLADFELTTLVRPIILANGAGWREPMWFQGGDERGLAIFVSALDAEIYRRFAIANGSSGWLRLPLSRFDLLDHVKALGGRLSCQVVFGFGASTSRELDTRDGLPRPLLVSVPFEVELDTPPPVTFQFNAWIFDFIREQWALVGPEGYAAQVESMNVANDAQLLAAAESAQQGVRARSAAGEEHDWCLYAPEAGTWHFGPTELRQTAHLH